MEQKLENMVNPEVYSRVDFGLKKYQTAKEAKELMDKCTSALASIKKRHPKERFDFTLSVAGYRVLSISEDNAFPELTFETIKQFVTLLEALYYNEMKEAIKEFDNTLNIKIEGDGKAAGK